MQYRKILVAKVLWSKKNRNIDQTKVVTKRVSVLIEDSQAFDCLCAKAVSLEDFPFFNHQIQSAYPSQ